MNLLTLIIPCFNEHESLPLLIQNLKKLNQKIKFIILNNGSTDETRKYLNNVASSLPPNIRFFELETNNGYGNGIFYALSHVENSKFIGWIHGDLQFEFDKLNIVYEDLLRTGDKKIYYKGIRKGRNIIEVIISHSMGIAASLILRKKMFEINAQPTIFNKELIDYFVNPPMDFSFDTYVYYLALKNNYTVKRRKFKFPPRRYGSSRWNFGLKSRAKFSFSLIKYFLKLRKKK